MAKWLPCRTAASAEVVRPIDTIIIGGLADRCVADSARKPAGPSVPLAVTIATPIARQQIAFQKVLASISVSMADQTVMCRSMNATIRSNMSPVLDRSGAWPTPRSMSIYSSAIEPPALR